MSHAGGDQDVWSSGVGAEASKWSILSRVRVVVRERNRLGERSSSACSQSVTLGLGARSQLRDPDRRTQAFHVVPRVNPLRQYHDFIPRTKLILSRAARFRKSLSPIHTTAPRHDIQTEGTNRSRRKYPTGDKQDWSKHSGLALSPLPHKRLSPAPVLRARWRSAIRVPIICFGTAWF